MSKWEEYVKIVEAKFPSFKKVLNVGIKGGELSLLEKSLNVTLPKEMHDIYKFSDGQIEKEKPILFGLLLLSIDEIKRSIKREEPLIEQLKGEWDMCSSFPKSHIKLAYANSKWIPLFYGGRGFIGLDFDPDESGIAGQVINFGIDDEDKFVYASSLSDFIDICISKLKEGVDVEYSSETGSFYYTDLYYPSALAKEMMGQ
ncbi:SMI1/KNR4 family protein [Aliikangiella coralliicola]|nr:SMI1/KNR4 family protein [Aliikangiella coralliicola]